MLELLLREKVPDSQRIHDLRPSLPVSNVAASVSDILFQVWTAKEIHYDEKLKRD